MEDLLKLSEFVLPPGGRRCILCSTLQFSNWNVTLEKRTETAIVLDDEKNESEVEMKSFKFDSNDIVVF